MGRGKVKSRDPFARGASKLRSNDDKYNLPPDPADLDHSYISRTAHRAMRRLEAAKLPEKIPMRKRKKEKEPLIKAEIREGESLKRFTKRLNAELYKKIDAINAIKPPKSEKKREHQKARKNRKKLKLLAKQREAELDRIADGETETIAFGDIVTRPPQFDILPQSTEEKKSTAQVLRMAQLAQLLRGKATAEATAEESEEEDTGEHKDRDTDARATKVKSTAQTRRPLTPAERAALIERAKEQAHQMEVERHREQVQAAYRALKEKKMHGHKGMSSLNKANATFTSGIRYSERALDALRENN